MALISSDDKNDYLDIPVEDFRIYKQGPSAYYLNGIHVFDNSSYDLNLQPQAICDALAGSAQYNESHAPELQEKTTQHKVENATGGGWMEDPNRNYSLTEEYINKFGEKEKENSTLYHATVSGTFSNPQWRGGEPVRPTKPNNIASLPTDTQNLVDDMKNIISVRQR